jgi:hypothetical protein
MAIGVLLAHWAEQHSGFCADRSRILTPDRHSTHHRTALRNYTCTGSTEAELIPRIRTEFDRVPPHRSRRTFRTSLATEPGASLEVSSITTAPVPSSSSKPAPTSGQYRHRSLRRNSLPTTDARARFVSGALREIEEGGGSSVTSLRVSEAKLARALPNRDSPPSHPLHRLRHEPCCVASPAHWSLESGP